MSGARNRTGLWPRIHGKATRVLHQARLRRSIRQIHGPSRLNTAPDDVTVVALVRDGLYYLEQFLAHHRSIGARHFVFIDNGSGDGTVERIARDPDTVILQSHLPWGLFENDFRRYAAQTYCANRWCLYADMDEMFDFEGSQTIGLTGLVRYLGANGFTALLAQMLEMFPDGPLRETAQQPYANALQRYSYCDTSHISAFDYHDPAIAFAYHLRTNILADQRIKFLFGGVRRRVFGENCALTKHPLVFVGPGVQPGVHPHCSSHVACGDFTALIRHYKFTNDPFGRDAQTVRNAAISHGEDRQRLGVAERDPGLTMRSETSKPYRGIGDLQDSGFLVPSARFTAFVDGGADV